MSTIKVGKPTCPVFLTTNKWSKVEEPNIHYPKTVSESAEMVPQEIYI